MFRKKENMLINHIFRKKKSKITNQNSDTGKEAIYSRIGRAFQEDHTLPADFKLEEINTQETIRFAPGALEGIFGHHTSGNSGNNEELYDFLVKRIKQLPKLVINELEKSGLLSNEMVISDGIIKQIYDNKEGIPADSLLNLACFFITDGTEEYTVKLGLKLLCLFNIDDNTELKNILLDLAVWEGFTEYVILNMSDWTDKNNAYFQLAKRLNGWGKIDAVERLEPETEEMKEWILCEGCRNSIMYSYLALICAEKCDLYHVLKIRKLNEREFSGTKDIIEGLLDEGPCDGISVIENANELLFMFVTQYEEIRLNIEDITLLDSILDYVNTYAGEDKIWIKKMEESIERYFSRTDFKLSILNSLHEKKQWYAVNVARKHNINIAAEYLEQLKNNFEANVNYISYLFEVNQHVEEAVKVCEDNLVYEKVAKGMGKLLGLGKAEHWNVDMVVQNLGNYPCLGELLIKASIHSPITRYRNMAAMALEGWKQKLNQPLCDISNELYHDIVEVSAIEVDEQLKERWKLLLQ